MKWPGSISRCRSKMQKVVFFRPTFDLIERSSTIHTHIAWLTIFTSSDLNSQELFWQNNLASCNLSLTQVLPGQHFNPSTTSHIPDLRRLGEFCKWFYKRFLFASIHSSNAFTIAYFRCQQFNKHLFLWPHLRKGLNARHSSTGWISPWKFPRLIQIAVSMKFISRNFDIGDLRPDQFCELSIIYKSWLSWIYMKPYMKSCISGHERSAEVFRQ